MHLCARVVNAKLNPKLRDGIHMECLEIYILSQDFEVGSTKWKRAQENKRHLKVVQ